MANNPSKVAPTDDFLEQILGLPHFGSAEAGLAGADGGLGVGSAPPPMMLQLSSGDGSSHLGGVSGGFHGQVFPLGLSLEQGKGGFLKPEDASGSGKRFRDDVVDGRAATMKNFDRRPPSPYGAAPGELELGLRLLCALPDGLELNQRFPRATQPPSDHDSDDAVDLKAGAPLSPDGLEVNPQLPCATQPPSDSDSDDAVDLEVGGQPAAAVLAVRDQNGNLIYILIPVFLTMVVDMALTAAQINSKYPPVFHFLSLTITLASASFLVSNIINPNLSGTARVLYRLGVLFTVAAFFLATSIPISFVVSKK